MSPVQYTSASCTEGFVIIEFLDESFRPYSHVCGACKALVPLLLQRKMEQLYFKVFSFRTSPEALASSIVFQCSLQLFECCPGSVPTLPGGCGPVSHSEARQTTFIVCSDFQLVLQGGE